MEIWIRTQDREDLIKTVRISLYATLDQTWLRGTDATGKEILLRNL